MSNKMDIQVSEGTLKKSQKLVDDDQIQDMGDFGIENCYQVKGSKAGEIYQIELDKIHGFVCRKTNASEPNEKGNLCMGWKNSRAPKICKHCYAVILYKKREE